METRQHSIRPLCAGLFSRGATKPTFRLKNFSLHSAREIDLVERKRPALGVAKELCRVSRTRTARRDLPARDEVWPGRHRGFVDHQVFQLLELRGAEGLRGHRDV